MNHNMSVALDRHITGNFGEDSIVEAEPRTAQEIERLKVNWICDPHWDIEETDGFEYHYDELKAWSKAYQAEESRKEQERLNERAAELGCTVALVQYIEGLEFRLGRLDGRE